MTAHGLAAEPDAIARARNGDHAAFGSLVEHYQEVAFRAAYLIVRDAPAAEDVAQDAFIRAYRALHTFRSGEPFRPWLLRIVTNTAINEVRARRRRTGLLGRVAAITAPAVALPDVALGDDDATMLAHKSQAQKIKEMVKKLAEKKEYKHLV